MGPIRVEYLEKFEKFVEEKAMQTEIARKKDLAKAMTRRDTSRFDDFDCEDSSIPSTTLQSP